LLQYAIISGPGQSPLMRQQPRTTEPSHPANRPDLLPQTGGQIWSTLGAPRTPHVYEKDGVLRSPPRARASRQLLLLLLLRLSPRQYSEISPAARRRPPPPPPPGAPSHVAGNTKSVLRCCELPVTTHHTAHSTQHLPRGICGDADSYIICALLTPNARATG
jgi:hypothetical protein